MIAEGTPPERFAIEHGHYSEDIAFWLGLADEVGGPVLDVGSAVGRVTLPIAMRGHQVCALDGSQGMLDALVSSLVDESLEVAARVTTARCDFRQIDLGDRRFRLAIMPMNSLQALLTRDEQLACLRGIRRHIASGGVFAFDVAMPDLDSITSSIGQVNPGATWRDPTSGASLAHASVFETVDPTSATVEFTTTIAETDADGNVAAYVRSHVVHLFSPTELWELLHEAGFEVHAVYGDFAGTPFSSAAEHQICRCGVVA